METRIYENYAEFLKRDNKKENGVSKEFAEEYPNYENQNLANEGCFGCFGCSGCFGCFGCSDCFGCFGCFDCSDCSGCFGCSDCFGCSGCFGCFDKTEEEKEKNILLNPPKIKNIHNAVYEAASKPNALDMTTWHTCDTTHCRAGWVVTLAGTKGKELERKTSTLFSAMMIYKASSPLRVSPPRFFEGNKVAMSDMKNMAEKEKIG